MSQGSPAVGRQPLHICLLSIAQAGQIMIPAGFTKNALRKICQSKTTHDTETGYLEFFIKSEIIKSKFFVIETTDFLNKIRLTLDYPEDLKLAKQIFLKLDPTFKTDDIITLFCSSVL